MAGTQGRWKKAAQQRRELAKHLDACSARLKSLHAACSGLVNFLDEGGPRAFEPAMHHFVSLPPNIISPFQFNRTFFYLNRGWLPARCPLSVPERRSSSAGQPCDVFVVLCSGGFGGQEPGGLAHVKHRRRLPCPSIRLKSMITYVAP